MLFENDVISMQTTQMSDRGLKLFLATAVFYFVARDIGGVVMLAKQEGSSLKKLKSWIKDHSEGKS